MDPHSWTIQDERLKTEDVGELVPLINQFNQTLITADLIGETVPFTSSSDNYPCKSQPWISLFLAPTRIVQLVSA
jgi:hypothetical protein